LTAFRLRLCGISRLEIMRRIVFPSCARSKRWFAVVVVTSVLAAASVMASVRPRFGGTLRVQMRERVLTIDPRQWPPGSEQIGAAERLEALIFDRLVRFDDHGVPQPMLAVSWQNDAQSKRWQFLLRKGVKFSDGSPLTPEVAEEAVRLRRQHRIKLPDAIIWASALNENCVLVSRNTKDFPSNQAGIRFPYRR